VPPQESILRRCRMSRSLLMGIAVVLAVGVTSQAAAAPRIGRCDVLLDAHGYNTGKGVVVPLRPVAEWLGATVTYRKPSVEVRLGDRVVSLKVGAREAVVDGKPKALSASAKVYGGTLCVPVRFVAEALGCAVEYVTGTERTEVVGHIEHVVVRAKSRQVRVLVHEAPPDVVAAIVAADVAKHGAAGRGTEYLLQVTRTAGNWAKAHEPDWMDAYGFGQHWRTGFYRKEGRGWVAVASSSRVSYARDDLKQMGVPVEVARALGSEVED